MLIVWRKRGRKVRASTSEVPAINWSWAPRAPVGAPLTAGTASFVSSGPTQIVVSATDATGGTPAYTYQWQRNANGGVYSNISNGGGVSGATTRTLTDGSAVAGTLYGYKLVYTDAVLATATSNAVTAQIYSGGSITTAGAIVLVAASGDIDMNAKLETTIYRDFITSDSSGAATDADSTPTVEVFEDATDTPLTVTGLTVAKRTSKTGDYRATIPVTAANGFESGKSYNAVASATVGGVAAKAVIWSGQVSTALVDDVYSRIGANGVGLTSVALVSTGLDAISAVAPDGVGTTFAQKLMQVWQRFFGKARKTITLGVGTVDVYKPSNQAQIGVTQAITDDGLGNETAGTAT